MTANIKYSWIDPPSGWQYGFPKAFTFEEDVTWSEEERIDKLCQWLENNGYPIERLGRWNLNHMRYGLTHDE